MAKQPIRRLWLYKRSKDELEIVMLGEPTENASMYMTILHTCERWGGWQLVEPLTMGVGVIGLVVKLGPCAGSLDPIAEAYSMFQHVEGITWTDGMQTAIGEW